MYFDHAATSPPSEALKSHLNELMDLASYNPSSSHKKGLELRGALEGVRGDFAGFLGVAKDEIFFTSGATEANNLILQGMINSKKKHIVSSAVEHDSVEQTLRFLEGQGFEVTRLEPSKLTTEEVLKVLRKDTLLVSIILVQNETGEVYPLEGLGKELSKKGVLYHRDMVQALGKIDFSLRKEEVDLASFSSHKLGGLKGLGMVYKKKELRLNPLLYGGDQERGLRPGTENTLAILALGQVLKEIPAYNRARIVELNKLIRERIIELGGRVISPSSASPYILAVSFKPPAEVLLTSLSMKGVYASAGSACHARSTKEARIARFLDAEEARGMIRLSMSPDTSFEEVEAMLRVLEKCLEEIKRYI